MIPVNQVILGGDPLLGGSVIGNSLDEQLQLLERYKQNLEAAKQMKQQIQPVSQSVPAQKLIWDDIDAEVEPMTEEQKKADYFKMMIIWKPILKFKVWSILKSLI